MTFPKNFDSHRGGTKGEKRLRKGISKSVTAARKVTGLRRLTENYVVELRGGPTHKEDLVVLRPGRSPSAGSQSPGVVASSFRHLQAIGPQTVQPSML